MQRREVSQKQILESPLGESKVRVGVENYSSKSGHEFKHQNLGSEIIKNKISGVGVDTTSFITRKGLSF